MRDPGDPGVVADEELADQPERQQHEGGNSRPHRDERKEDHRADPGPREPHEVGPHDTGHRPRCPDERHRRVDLGEHVGGGRDHAGDEVEEQERKTPHLVFDVVAEDPEEKHVAEEVKPAGVQEHRDEHRQPDVFVGKRADTSTAESIDACLRVSTLDRGGDLSSGQGTSLAQLARDRSPLVGETNVLDRLLLRRQIEALGR